MHLWTAGFFYCQDEATKGNTFGLPPFVNVAAEDNESWDSCPNRHGQADLNQCIRRIAKLVSMGLTGQDLVLCWVKRQIQPLQHHERLMHEYTGPNDSLQVCQAEITSTALDQKMRRMVKIGCKVKEHTYSFGLDMFINNKCPKVISQLLIFAQSCLVISA